MTRRRRGIVGLLLSAALATCSTDQTPTGPSRGGRAYLAFQPTFKGVTSPSAFGFTIDSLRAAVIRPPSDTVVDTTVFFNPDSSSIRLAISVDLTTSPEIFNLLLQLRAGTQVLYSGVEPRQVFAGPPTTPSADTIALKYVGPGAGITHIGIAPKDSVLTLAGTQQYRVTADSSGVPVTSFFVRWSTSDTLLARIDSLGILHAPAVRGSLLVRATTPTNVRDSTPVTFIPVPTGVAVASGGGQTGVVATRLPLPVRVQVVASDAQGVKGIPVRFRSLSGGSVRDSVVTTDVGGFAADSVTLGTVAGSQLFEASVSSLKPDTIGVTASPGAISAAQSVVTVSGATVVSGTGATLTLQAKDAFGNSLTTGGATVAFTATGGTSTGSIGPATDNNNGTYTTTFTGVLAGTATTIGATINGTAVSTTLPTLTVTPGAISATSLVSVSSTSVASGSSVTLTLQAKDAAGNSLSTGGATVAFTTNGGTSTGAIGGTIDHANGTYTATFTGIAAGTATSIGATINGTAVTTVRPTLSVIAGAISAATSVVTVTSGTVASGASATLTLQAKDAAGNSLTTGGTTVSFSASGGTSTGTIGSVTDRGDGTYSATFTGVIAGTATTVGAKINGTATVSTAAIIVVPGNAVTAQSIITVSLGTLASGAVDTLTLQARDSVGNPITKGGLTVVFTNSGGTSTGTISATIDHGNGTYTATFTGVLAGTATTIGATIGGSAVTSTLPTVTVAAGAISPATSVVTVSSGTVASGLGLTLTLQAKDAAGNALTAGGSTVVFTATGGTSTGTIGATTDHANGSYTATFSAVLAGTPTTIGATINAVAVTSALPTVTVTPGAISTAKSVVTTTAPAVLQGATDTLLLQARDAAGNNLTSGGALVVFTQSGGTSVGSISTTTDLGNGTYRGFFTGTIIGTPTTIGATISGVAVTTTPLPTVQVTATVHSVDITADSTWTAALSPHVVNGYLRIINGAKLTIQAGAVVKFNAGSGLQVGDTVLNQAGGLILDGTGPGITLTANTTSPTPGFWKGIEVQRNLALTTWRRTLIEWAGGTRTAFGTVPAEACILFVNRSGAEVDLDSLRVRQCVHAGVHHFGGTSHIRRSEIDSTTGSGIHADFDATLQLDSTTVRGSGQEGLLLASTVNKFLPSRFNRFVGNATSGITLHAFQLPGLLKQDSIAGNGQDLIQVSPGQPDPTVSAFTIFAQPQRAGSHGYLIGSGLLDIGSSGGQTVTLDSNVVLRFVNQSGVNIGDSAGTRSGSIVSLGTNRTNAPRLTSASVSPAPGDWYGLEIGRLSTNTRLANVRIEFAGDSIGGRSRHRFGLMVRSPAAQTLALDSVLVFQSGKAGSDTNTAGIGVLASGAGVDIRRSVTQGNLGYGFALAGVPNVKAVADTARSNTIGFALFADSGVSAVAPGDSVAGNVAAGNTLYPLSLDIRRLPVLFPNSFTGNGRDTLLVDGHRIAFTGTLPHFPGLPWRVTHGPIQIDSGGSLTLAAGDTLAFDNGTAILVGQSLPAALRVPGTGALPVLLTATPGQPSWLGLFFQNLSQADTLANVIIERAGRFVPPPPNCGIDLVCPTSLFGSIRFTNSSSFGLLLDTVTVRNSVAYAVEALPTGTGTVTIRRGQFYANLALFHASSGVALSVTQSDMYDYRQVVVVNGSSTPGDSVAATNNWWGDILGPDTGSVGADSLGRATTGRQAVRTTPFATSSFFLVGGPATALVPTRDSLSPALSTSALIGVRAVDASGRGVPGVPISWSAPSGTTITPPTGTGDGGGRVVSQWQFMNSAGRKVATATGSGVSAAQLVANVQPGSTVVENWTVLPALSQGTVTGQRAITFTSTNRRGVIVTSAHDSFGNATQPSPSSICAAAPGQPCPFVFPPYAQIDSTHTSGGTNGDTIFFHANVTSPSPFVLRATYVGPNASLLPDSITITMSPVVGGVRIDHDPNTPGIQSVPDTVRINSLCPTGPGNASCSTTYAASVVDSGGTALPPGNAFFIWHLVPPTGSVTLDSMNVFPHDVAYVTARSNGFIRLAVKDTSGNNFGTDTLPILVQQLPSIVLVTPDTVSVPVGGTTTFHGTVVDAGGDTMSTLPVHWRNDNTFNPHVTITDTSVANQVTVRLDSTPLGGENVTAYAIGGPGDTAYGLGQVVNPLILRVGVGLQPWAIAANSQSHAIFVGHQGGQLYQIDGTTEARVDSVAAGKFVSAVAVNSITNRVYAGTDLGVAVFDGTLSPITTVGAGTNHLGVSNLQGLTVDSINNRVYVAVDIGSAAPNPVLRQIDGSTNTFSTANDVPLPGHGTSAAFDPVNGLVYVAIPDSNFIVAVDPVAKTFIRISAGTTPTYVAVNPVTNRVYVGNTSSDNITVIDASSGTALTTIPVFYTPGSIAVDAVNNRVYVGTSGLPYLLVVNGSTNVFSTVLAVGNPSLDSELGVAFDAGNKKVWTANNASNGVSRVKY